MQHIETIELTASQSSITFSPIPQDYDDLIILVSARSDRSGEAEDVAYMTFNSSTSNYSTLSLEGTGSTVSSDTAGGESSRFDRLDIPGPLMTSNTFGNISLYVSNYTQAQAKSISADVVEENNATFARQRLNAYLWNDTSAITSITFNAISNFVTGTTVSLYGISAGGDGTVTTS